MRQIERSLGATSERGNVCAAGGCGSLIWNQWRLLFLIESMALSGSSEDSSLSSSKTTPHDLQTGVCLCAIWAGGNSEEDADESKCLDLISPV